MTAPDSCETPAAPATSLSRRRLLVTSGLGWMFDALDVGLLAFVLAALQVAWGLSRAEITAIGSPSSSCARCRKTPALPASRRVCVATARVCMPGNLRRRWPNAARHCQPRCMAASDKSPVSASSPPPRRTVSFRYCRRSKWSFFSRAISRRKLLAPRSIAAQRQWPARARRNTPSASSVMERQKGKSAWVRCVFVMQPGQTKKPRSHC